ncbi:hypothetical protein B6U79_02465 [Candidatus Bathyarchaeota archaeon ex4484_231]|nr:MAG: hypothetical protein B6U79_02465 [Candidatus Bathyarchaeota archaeon ex4484_231]
MEQDLELRSAVSMIINAGYQLDREAFEFLEDASKRLDINRLVKSIIEEVSKLPNKPLLINRELLEKKASELWSSEAAQKSMVTGKTGFQPFAKEVEADLTVLEDPAEKLSGTGSLNEYIEYFKDRFKKLSRILNRRVDVRNAVTIVEAFKAPVKSEVKIICMVTEKRESSRGIFIQVEDLEANATIFVPSNNHEVFRKGQRLVLDQVVCFSIVKGERNFFIAKDILLPDIPMRKPNLSPTPVYAALLSDLHVGSSVFMRRSFKAFLSWLKGEIGNSHARETAGHVKYIIIAGDIVDGVGIYPQQITELEIKDIYKQYQAAAELISQIPDYIEVIMIPGNHDAVRRALPQPALPKEYAEPLYESREIHSLGNPAYVSLNGVNVLVSHGRSLDDIISNVPGMSFQKPDDAMKFLLQCRHLSPIYGARTLIAPEKRDCLVIENTPDIYHAGHVHRMSFSNYRGTLIVNSGAWQGQTEYQREMGHNPNPGIAPIVNLQTLEVIPIDFSS